MRLFLRLRRVRLFLRLRRFHPLRVPALQVAQAPLPSGPGRSQLLQGPGGASSRLAVQDHLSAAGGRKSTRLNSSHVAISYAVFCLKKKNNRPLPSFPSLPPRFTLPHHVLFATSLI